MELFISVVDAKLFQAILLEHFKTINIQYTDKSNGIWSGVAAARQLLVKFFY